MRNKLKKLIEGFEAAIEIFFISIAENTKAFTIKTQLEDKKAKRKSDGCIPMRKEEFLGNFEHNNESLFTLKPQEFFTKPETRGV